MYDTGSKFSVFLAHQNVSTDTFFYTCLIQIIFLNCIYLSKVLVWLLGFFRSREKWLSRKTLICLML